MELPKYSIGIGDRFAHQGKAQLSAFAEALKAGVEIAPVWNKSYREHSIVGSAPADVRAEADAAVRVLGWKKPYFVDADHISLKTVDGFMDSSDFFTLDVADFIGKSEESGEIGDFAKRRSRYTGKLEIPGVARVFAVSRADVESIAGKYLHAVRQAGKIYRRIAEVKASAGFVIEVSMDETDSPQTPLELFFILAAVADEGIPVSTVAPKFSGRFNKGVDYVGDPAGFEAEFEEDLCAVAYAIDQFGLKANLKLSVHSGSDKFSLYPRIRKAIRKRGAGLHLKTAGTTWLEEVTGLALAGDEGLMIAKEFYVRALERLEEMRAPYATVIDIDARKLPTAETVAAWSGERFARALRHDLSQPEYDPGFRQLIHVSYKIAAEMGKRYTDALEANEALVAKGVAANILERHIRPLFLD